MDIILIGRIAEAGILEKTAAQKEIVAGRFSQGYLKRGIAALRAGYISEEQLSALTQSCICVRRLNGESIYGGLWNLGEELGHGLRVYLHKIAIAGFCIEVADLLDVSPYLLDSTGCVLAVAGNGQKIVSGLTEAGIQADIIGYLTDDRDRCICNGEITSYLTGHETE